VIVGVVGYDVPGGDLGGELRFAADAVPDLEEGALTPSRSRISSSCSVYGWHGPSSKVKVNTRSCVRACQNTDP